MGSGGPMREQRTPSIRMERSQAAAAGPPCSSTAVLTMCSKVVADVRLADLLSLSCLGLGLLSFFLLPIFLFLFQGMDCVPVGRVQSARIDAMRH